MSVCSLCSCMFCIISSHIVMMSHEYDFQLYPLCLLKFTVWFSQSISPSPAVFFNVAAVNSVHADNFPDVGRKLNATAALKCLCFHLHLSQNLCSLWHITHLFLDKSISLFMILQWSFEILFHLWKMPVLLQYCRSSPPEQICSSSVAAQSKILLFFMHFEIGYSTTVIKMVRICHEL